MRSLLVLWMLAAGMAEAAPEALAPQVDWPVRTLPTDPPRVEALQLRQVWRLDGGEDADTVLGQVVAAAPGLDGRVLACDAQVTQVLVVGPTGARPSRR